MAWTSKQLDSDLEALRLMFNRNISEDHKRFSYAELEAWERVKALALAKQAELEAKEFNLAVEVERTADAHHMRVGRKPPIILVNEEDLAAYFGQSHGFPTPKKGEMALISGMFVLGHKDIKPLQVLAADRED